MEFNQHYFQVTQIVSDKMPGIKKADGPHKYNKVNQQKKYHLLTLVYKRNLSLRDAAAIVGINYLTAKTILFFHKNNHKSYQFDLQMSCNMNFQVKNVPTAFYTTLKKKNPLQEKLHYQKSRIEVICSIGNVLNPPKSSVGYSKEAIVSAENMFNSIYLGPLRLKMSKKAKEYKEVFMKPLFRCRRLLLQLSHNQKNLKCKLDERIYQAPNKLLQGLQMMKIEVPSGAMFGKKNEK